MAAIGAAGAVIAGGVAYSDVVPVQLLILNPIVISARAQAGIFPQKARAAHESGSAIVRCAGKSGARLSGCVVVDELPTDVGMGATALAIATNLNASHIPVDPRSEAAIVVKVDFDYPDAPPPVPYVPRQGWDHLPTTSDLTLYYPENAARMNQEGWALLRCVVTSEGSLSPCRVAAEAPTDFGFGKAALDLSKDYRMKPSAGLAGRTINITINFRFPRDER